MLYAQPLLCKVFSWLKWIYTGWCFKLAILLAHQNCQVGCKCHTNISMLMVFLCLTNASTILKCLFFVNSGIWIRIRGRIQKEEAQDDGERWGRGGRGREWRRRGTEHGCRECGGWRLGIVDIWMWSGILERSSSLCFVFSQEPEHYDCWGHWLSQKSQLALSIEKQWLPGWLMKFNLFLD